MGRFGKKITLDEKITVRTGTYTYDNVGKRVRTEGDSYFFWGNVEYISGNVDVIDTRRQLTDMVKITCMTREIENLKISDDLTIASDSGNSYTPQKIVDDKYKFYSTIYAYQKT